MAIILQKDDDFGGTGAQYWRVVETNINYNDKTSQVVLFGYVNKQQRELNKRPVKIKKYSWNGADFPFSANAMNEKNPIKISYNLIKQTSDFSAGVDDDV